MDDSTTKRCSVCQEIKPIVLFTRDRTKRDGYGYRCKACCNAADRATRNGPLPLKRADPNATEKLCSVCLVALPLTAFYKHKASFDGLMPRCKDCDRIRKRDWNKANRGRINRLQKEWEARNPGRAQALYQRHYLKSKYGMTHEGYAALLDQQERKCAICGEEYQHKNSKIGPLEIDHDHATGAVRGLLCRGCNMGIGIFGESVERMRAAIAYIERAKDTAS